MTLNTPLSDPHLEGKHWGISPCVFWLDALPLAESSWVLANNSLCWAVARKSSKDILFKTGSLGLKEQEFGTDSNSLQVY